MFIDAKLQRYTAAACSITRVALCGASSFVLLAACAQPPKAAEPKQAPPPASASAAPSSAPPEVEPPLPTLSATSLPALEVPAVQELTLVRRGQDGAFELLEYALPDTFSVNGWGTNEVRVAGQSMPYAFVASTPDHIGAQPTELWVRRPMTAKPAEVTGDFYGFATNGMPGSHYRFHAGAPDKKVDPKALALWVNAMIRDLEGKRGPFYRYAEGKLRERLTKAQTQPSRYYYRTPGDLAALIGTTTGRTAVQEALQNDQQLYLDLEHGARTVPMSKLSAPHVTRHPWAQMLGQLHKNAPQEPLASATPADFYFVRVRDFATFLDLTAVLDSWGTPALDLLDGRISERDLRGRYQTQLALEQTELARTFGPSVIDELAIVGSDPYLVEGSDLTLIFKVKSSLLFDAALLKALDSFATAHPGMQTTKFSHEGVEVTATRSQDGLVRRHRATVDGLELVSNSPAAIRRVISAIHGKTARLADEPDFNYMLARDAERDGTVLAYAGDRFVESVIGPQQKLKAAERELALAELSRPGFASLFYGYLNGHSPSSVKDLLQAKLLSAQDLAQNGVAAGFQPGGIAQNSRGSTTDLVPLIDTPDLTTATEAEQAGYASFARSYESEWSEYVDPFAVRFARSQTQSGTSTLQAELRVLPLLRREYSDFTSSVGDARVQPGEQGDGARLLLGVGADADIRHLLTRATRSFSEHELAFDWIGDYAFVGVADRNELAVAARAERDYSPEQPPVSRNSDDDMHALEKVPAYAGIAIRSMAGATIALAMIKGVADSVGSDSLIWSEAQKHRGVALMSVHSRERSDLDLTLYYALTPHVLLFSLNQRVLAKLVDDALDGKAPSNVARDAQTRAPQLVLDVKGKPQGALSTVLTWLLTRTLVEGSSAAFDQASAIFHGAPEAAADPDQANTLMRNYFGSQLRTPEGSAYTFGPDGVRDPLRGSPSSPKWPAIPVTGSPVAKVVDRLDSLRSEVAFDDEPNGGQPGTGTPLRSLRVHLTVTLRQ